MSPVAAVVPLAAKVTIGMGRSVASDSRRAIGDEASKTLCSTVQCSAVQCKVCNEREGWICPCHAPLGAHYRPLCLRGPLRTPKVGDGAEELVRVRRMGERAEELGREGAQGGDER